jgi:hypothetical protein
MRRARRRTEKAVPYNAAMRIAQQNPFPWLLLLLTAWACLAAPQWGAKTASGKFYGQESASGEMTGREAAPRLGFGGLAEKNASGALVAAKEIGTVGKSVLGHYPEYKTLAESLSARRFNIPESAWNKMSEAERWGANQKFLDRMISRGDDVILATPLDKVRPGSYFARELEYMSSRGYVPSADGTRLILQGGR